jgi:CheY-like chemotaxis protein
MSTVLLVDDDQVTVARNSAALAAAGHRVAVASTTAEAIASIRHMVPDIVILEGLLDGTTAGFDLARALASSHPDLPLIMLTRADDVLSPRERADQDRDGGWLPVQRYLEKPVMPEVLADEVEHLVHEPAAAL